MPDDLKPDPLHDQLRDVDPRLPEFIEPLLTIVNGCTDKRVQRAALQTAALVGAALTAEQQRRTIVAPRPTLTGPDWYGFPRT